MWDEDNGVGQRDELMGKIPRVQFPNGNRHLQLEEAMLTQLDVKGEGKLYHFKING